MPSPLKYTPVNSSKTISEVQKTAMKEDASGHFKKFLESLGFDLNDPNMQGTPDRVARMYIDEVFSGCFTAEPKVTTFDLTDNHYSTTKEMVITGPLTVRSLCSHHMMPIVGKAWVGVILDENRLNFPGLSKYSRIVEYYSRRPQIQEQLTQQIHNHISETLSKVSDADTARLEAMQKDAAQPSVMVVIKAKHYCMAHRGVLEHASKMITSSPSGKFLHPAVRNEFFHLAGIK